VSPVRTAGPGAQPGLALAVTALMKGIVYRDTHDKAWRQLVQIQSQVRDYVAVIGLTVVIDEAEGYAFLRQRPDEADTEPDQALPRLIVRRTLSFHVSLLLALLRKKLAEADASNGGTRLMLTRAQIVDTVRLFQPTGGGDSRLVGQIDAHIAKAVELGFLRPVPGEDLFEVRRILKAFVDAQWLADFDRRLAQYAAQLAGDSADDGPVAVVGT
jgi:Domain of unknown function (DUF4194)